MKFIHIIDEEFKAKLRSEHHYSFKIMKNICEISEDILDNKDSLIFFEHEKSSKFQLLYLTNLLEKAYFISLENSGNIKFMQIQF